MPEKLKDPKDLRWCFFCGKPATNVVVTTKSSHGFCAGCYITVWDVVPDMLYFFVQAFAIK